MIEKDWKFYKRCSQCWELKEMTWEFWHKGQWEWGWCSQCKTCRNKNWKNYRWTDKAKAIYKKWADENKEHLTEYRKKRKENNKWKLKGYYIKAKETTIKEYREKNKEQIAKKQKTRYDSKGYSEAHHLTNRQLQKLKKSWVIFDTCSICWDKVKIVAHHPDYNKWREVVFCCYSCHQKIHNWTLECPKPVNIRL